MDKEQFNKLINEVLNPYVKVLGIDEPIFLEEYALAEMLIDGLLL
jgi:hypothetical protein